MSEALLTITSREDAVELTLTRTSVSMRLAQATLDEVREELHAEPDRDAPGLTGRFVRFVTDSVENLVSKQIEYTLDDLSAIEYSDDRLVITYLKKHLPTFDAVHVTVDGKTMPALAAFREDDARAFAQRFAEAKTAAGAWRSSGDGLAGI
jgi:hypothetical protein